MSYWNVQVRICVSAWSGGKSVGLSFEALENRNKITGPSKEVTGLSYMN